jgi:thiamine biosynthesis protein ThiI
MEMNLVVIRYHEVALKGGNRQMFVRQLVENILRALRGTGAIRAHRAPGRIILSLAPGADWPEVRRRLRRVFGIANFLLCERSEPSLEALCRRVVDVASKRGVTSFAVRTKRTDKTFPVLSPEVSRLVGRAVQERTRSRVDLGHPELEIHVEILPREILFSLEKVDGPGGLPVGSSGTALVLLSGGIDSPVAAHRMMRRGCRVEFVHFHGAPYQSRASREKALELLEVLSGWQPDARLHLVPFGPVQRQIVRCAPPRPRVVLYRRMMVRIASAIALRVGATALVTGDSLGQVASQTLPNLAVVENASALPLLRPLIGMDKQEITSHAESLGTFPISIQPDEDCCQLFVPRHPATNMTVEEAVAAEAALEIDGMVDAALRRCETVEVAFPIARRGGTAASEGARTGALTTR